MTQSRKDLFQAHRLMTQRASLALLRGEPDTPDQPLRRLNVAGFSSALVAVIVAVLFAILAVLGHGGGKPRLGPGMLLIDSQTGTPYVFCQKSKLCPVLNYASARLALGGSSVTQQTVSQDDLTSYPRGPLIGIPGLPQPLPAPGLLVRGPWSVCTRDVLGPGGRRPVTVLAGGIDVGGHPLLKAGLLLSAGGKDWLVWHGERLAVAAGMLPALVTSRQPVPAAPAWVGALPEGPGLAPPAIAGRGERVPGPSGAQVPVGQVYQVRPAAGAPRQFYVMLRDGLATITQLQALLLEFQPNAPGGSALTLSPSQIPGHVSKTPALPAHGLPPRMPYITGTGPASTLCDVYPAAGPDVTPTGEITVGGTMPHGGVPTANASGVSQIVLPPGAGALAGSVPGGPSGTVTSYFLVSAGRRYGLASKSVAAMLGYQLASKLDRLPASVVDLIPAGPALDPASAARPVRPGG